MATRAIQLTGGKVALVDGQDDELAFAVDGRLQRLLGPADLPSAALGVRCKTTHVLSAPCA
jgi:hypothetical protein